MRQNNTRFGIVFFPRTLFTWQNKQDKKAHREIINRDGTVQQIHGTRILAHYNPYDSLPIIQDTHPVVLIPFGYRWLPRPQKWSVAVLQSQHARLSKTYKKTMKLKHKLMRAIRKGNRTYLRVIEPIFTSATNTHTSSLRFCAYSTSIDRNPEHTTSPTVNVSQVASRILPNTPTMTSLPVMEVAGRHTTSQPGTDEVDPPQGVIELTTAHGFYSSGFEHHEDLDCNKRRQDN